MIPKYKEVAEQIENNIFNGVYNEKNKLPTVEELVKNFNVSKNTIRSAIELLVSWGYIYQVQGSGIFIRPITGDNHINLSNMRGLTRDCVGDQVSSKILKFELITADNKIADKMKCKVGTKVYNVKRVRYVNGKPLSLEDSYFNKEVIPFLNEQIIESSIYRYITKDLNQNIGFADKVIYCEKASSEDAELIGIESGENTLILENTVYLSNGIIFDYCKAKYNYKDTKFINVSYYK